MRTNSFSALLGLIVGMGIVLSGSTEAGEPTVVREWSFNTDGAREGWTGVCHIGDAVVKDGVLSGTMTGRDPFIATGGPALNIPARPWNVFQARVRIRQEGKIGQRRGELFYANDNAGPYNGYSQAKAVGWMAGGANEWKTVEIYPFWEKQGRITKLRFDFPVPADEQFGKARFEIDWIRIVDLKLEDAAPIQPRWKLEGKPVVEWQSPMFTLEAEKIGSWLMVETSAGDGQSVEFAWMDDKCTFHSTLFELKRGAGGRTYNVRLADSRAWRGKVHQFRLRVLPDLGVMDIPARTAAFESVAVCAQPQGPAQVDMMFCGIEDAMVRVGYETAFFLDIVNKGGEDSGVLKLEDLKLPEGVTAVGDWTDIERLKIGERRRLLFPVKVDKVVAGHVEFKLNGSGLEEPVRIPMTVLASLNLPKADYVPEPKPVKSEYEIGALYFPGWYHGHSWSRIWSRCPDRRPLLGWYNESSPEVIDWQIKWSVENGISYYLVDWYWHKGDRHLEHWVKGFQQAKYRKYLKWAMMWANHNAAGSHSLEDQAAVTRYWIDNYFNTPEYYRIDGRPVVMIWSPGNMDRDVAEVERKKGNPLKRGEGCKMLLDLSRKMVKEAGFKGIYFVSMKWPEASTNASDIQWLADAGFDMTSIYHFMDDGGKAATRRKFSFDLVVKASRPYWLARHETGILPFLPNLATGWDDRPWKDHCWIYGRSPDKFGEICGEFKAFSEETGVKRAVLAPVNEWGEGSYAEPCREFGFGMYEAVREHLCEKPAEGWPLNYGPKDVGLGPYEYTEGARY